MHFGADRFQKISLRNVTAERLPGRQIVLKGGEIVKIPFRGDEAARFGPECKGRRVVDVPELAKLLPRGTHEKRRNGRTLTVSFTSAEFAVQMTESPGPVEIKVGTRP